MSTPTSNLPLDDRSRDIKISFPVLLLSSTCFVALRIWNDVRTKKRWYANISDWLLVFAQVAATIAAVCGYITSFHGAGRHVWDPSVTRYDIGMNMKYLWFGQFFNLTAMAALKFSICAFMLQLDFSKTFRRLIWLSVFIHTAFNVIYPYITLLGGCRPIAKHWDPTLSGYCWSPMPKVISGYLGAASNIASDFLYTCAPVIYTRKVQLPRRAIWGVRVVFLLGFITTIISAFKLYQIKALGESHDVGYESVDLSILSVAEVFVGTITASLPPLRRLFETMLSKVLPESVMGTKNRTQTIPSYVLPQYSAHKNTKRTMREDHDRDDSSEKTILSDTAGISTQIASGKCGEIVRTTHVSLTVDNTKPQSNSRTEEWA